MAKTKGNDYFAMMEEMVGFSCRAAEMLGTILGNFNRAEIDENMKRIHEIEHAGDGKKHQLVALLVKEFITPIEREDILAITSQIDDITDAVEDVLIKIYMYNLSKIPADVIAFIEIAKQCCEMLLDVFKEFGNFKKSKTIHDAIVRINKQEEAGDALYIKAVHRLYNDSEMDAKETAAWTEIYNCLEKVCDTCEHTADLVEHVIMKNT